MKEIHEFLIKIEVPLYKIFHFIKIPFKINQHISKLHQIAIKELPD